MDEYYERLSSILEEQLPADPPSTGSSGRGLKVIHDPLWGSVLFYPWEISVIDTPLFQRLRRIHQLGGAFFTYPSAIHTRFSHSLGVAALAGRLIGKIKEKKEVLDIGPAITGKDVYTVRLSGLLHDIGHCFLSHTSEIILKPIVANYPVYREIGSPPPHEFFSYLIITNPRFKEYWDKNAVPLFKNPSDVPDLKEVAEFIVGRPPDNGRRFLQEIINGPYDVDKLEYLFRDAKMAGLDISYDIERFFYKITLFFSEPNTWRLVMDYGGVRAVEQIIFSKMMLHSFVYHHQKVLAADALITDLLLELINESPSGRLEGNIKIEHPLDFLLYTDFDIMSSAVPGPSSRFALIRERLLSRKLPKRCFALNKEFVINLSSDTKKIEKWEDLLKKLRGFPEDILNIRQEIVDIMKEISGDTNLTIDDLYVIFPHPPKIREASAAPVLEPGGSLASMDQYFDLKGWHDIYEVKKLRGYFFASAGHEELGNRAVVRYLKEKGLDFKPISTIEAKIKTSS